VCGRTLGRVSEPPGVKRTCDPCRVRVGPCRALRAYQARVESRRPGDRPPCGPYDSGPCGACFAFVCRSNSLLTTLSDTPCTKPPLAQHLWFSIPGAASERCNKRFINMPAVAVYNSIDAPRYIDDSCGRVVERWMLRVLYLSAPRIGGSQTALDCDSPLTWEGGSRNQCCPN
jgi:hypothetical protein